MTIVFNVTDAIGSAPDHGITRTERRLAAALLGRPDVSFGAVAGGRLWAIPDDVVAAATSAPAESSEPRVERLGVTPAVAVPSRVRRIIHRAISRASTSRARRATPFGAMIPADRDLVLVSAGLDWVRDVPSVADRIVFGGGGRFVGFCYDTIPIDHPEWLFPSDPRGFDEYFLRASRVAERIIAISESTRRDFCRLYPDFGEHRVSVLRLGADAAVTCEQYHREFAAALFDGEPFAIYTATIDRRKNHHTLYRAVRELARRGVAANVLFVGRMGNGTTDLIDAIRHDRSVVGRFTHVSDCDDRFLAACYERASFAVYPSLYEGWGLGVTEAMAHGKSCLVASGSSLGEAGLGLCRELHPLRTLDWADAIAEFFEEPPNLPSFTLPTWEDAASSLVGLVMATVEEGST